MFGFKEHICAITLIIPQIYKVNIVIHRPMLCNKFDLLYNNIMDLDLRILMKMQSEINYLIVNRDLTHLPKVAILLKQYCSLNDIDEEELEKLIRLSEKYGC